MREITISGTRIADDTDAWVVAEIGCNHQGNLTTALSLIQAAAECGCQAVKFQKRDNRTLFTSAEYNVPYTSSNAFGATYGAHREALEFGPSEYQACKTYAEDRGLTFFATAFDVPSVEFLARLGVPAIKAASAALTNHGLLEEMALVGVPIIVSTGGATLNDVRQAHYTVARVPHVLLQCTAVYPAAPSDLNLGVIATYRDAFPSTVVGLSDHQDGVDMGPAAYVLGARVFEKHFTLDHNWRGSDHRFSLEPDGMRRFVRGLRRTREALGDGVKLPLPAEAPNLRKMGRRDALWDQAPGVIVGGAESLSARGTA